MQETRSSQIELKNIPASRRNMDRLFKYACMFALIVATGMLVVLLVKVAINGAGRLSWQFLTSNGSRMASRAGVYPALIGSLWIVTIAGLVAVPIGVAAAIYLEEFQRRKTKLTHFIQLNIANLAGVPSIVYGLLGLGIFVYVAGMGRSILAGSLTMALLILPTIILVSQEALKAVPSSFRDGSMALGATRWQTIRKQVLPAALPSIYTGIILSLSRAIGETAPLITVGAATYMSYAPSSPSEKFTVLPIQIFSWVGRPQQGFQDNAAAAILVLLVVLLSLNSFAIILRSKAQARMKQ
ncbi:MAG TPA: phosphate ABC transporter permease PstA [Fimbriimonas sp.]|nr:phosphate ABC transporter permease PstA [Fimbriimonas sp.]